MGESDCIINSVIIGVVISFVMPNALLMLANSEQIKQPLQGLSQKEKLLHLMAHKKDMPLLSAIIVGLIVAASVYLGYVLKPMKVMKDLL